MKGDTIHTRKITIELIEGDEKKLQLRGHLVDERSRGFRRLDDVFVEAGPLHDMQIDLEVGTQDFVITAARASMSIMPDPVCAETIPGIASLVGVRVTKGFTPEVKRLIGGTRGCAHLVNLALAMGPTAAQAISALSQTESPSSRVAATHEHVMGTCYFWSPERLATKPLHNRAPGS